MATDPHALTPMEREALRIAITSVTEPARREALEQQASAARVKQRDYTGAGFYTFLDCPETLRSDALPDGTDQGPAAAFSIEYPGDDGALVFLVYTQDGLLYFLEGASSGMWYEDAASAGCWPGTQDPIVFDPDRIKLG